ncbi:MAG: redoxin domain-containing protein [Planctomycetes bacterium]|nr:redoxin domain-containing protein [Planctomycetota bacterium]
MAFQDENGKTRKLYDLKGKKATVVVFLSFECPVSNSYAQPLSDMASEYGKHGVQFIGITTNQEESSADVAKHVKEFNINFPVYRDAKLAAADAFKAEITPEVFVLDADAVLRYRGRIDDSYSERLKKHPRVTKENLKQVLGEVLSGRPVSETATVAVGCPIQRQDKTAAKAGEVTYYRDVAPILQKNCQQCHRPGEVGPFSLMNYRQAVNWAEDIKSYTQKELMPPWKPSDGPAFHNERRLSQKDIDTLAAWAENGTPEGDPKDAPPPRNFPVGWQLGTPDLILSAEDDFLLGPTGRDVFRCFVLPTNLGEDKYVTAVELRPSNPRIVHHVLLFIDSKGQAKKLEQAAKEKKPDADHPDDNKYDRGPGYSVAMGVGFLPQGGLSGWAPGQMPRFLPEGSGYLLPKNSDVVMQIHYHRDGRAEKDRTQIGLYFAKKKVDRPFQGGVIAGGGGTGALGRFFVIPAGNERFHLQGDSFATADFTLHNIMPHMHMLGKEVTVTTYPPDGPPKTLVGIKEWDYNWQETYIFKEPIHIKAGTRLHVDAYYDNSANNPNNPNSPPRPVTFGEQTFNEMCFVFLGGTSNSKARRLPLSPKAPAAK